MTRHTRINIALAVVIIILLMASFGINDEAPVETVRVSDINASSIDTIEVIRADKTNLVFNKQTDHWRMQEPLQIRANSARINAMLRLLNSESFNQLDPSTVELSRFELEQPAVILKMNEHVFQFGNTDGIDQRRYVLFNGTIYMVNDFLYAQLASNPGFFSDTRLLPESKKIKSIAFPENTFTLVDGQWKMEKLMDIKPDQLKELAYSWENARAVSVSSYQQPEQDFVITITTTDDETLLFNIIKTEPHLVLGRKALGIQYHLGSDEAQRLLLQQEPAAESEPSPG